LIGKGRGRADGYEERDSSRLISPILGSTLHGKRHAGSPQGHSHVDVVIMHIPHEDGPVKMSLRVMRGVRYNSSTKDKTVEPHIEAILTK
jgi:hypothetical protein